jgi:hypothetical protein
MEWAWPNIICESSRICGTNVEVMAEALCRLGAAEKGIVALDWTILGWVVGWSEETLKG